MNDLSCTCLMLTRNRKSWLPRALKSFEWQTYENRRLLILADGEDVSDVVPKDDPRITLVQFSEAERPRTVGAKRNVGCAMASTDLIAVMDDDDVSGPDRLKDQIGRLQATGTDVTGYGTMPFVDGPQWWVYYGTKNFALGTSLCFKRSWWAAHTFPEQDVGEDNAFVAGAVNVISVADGTGQMVASIWPGNTSVKCCNGPTWKKLPPEAAPSWWEPLHKTIGVI